MIFCGRERPRGVDGENCDIKAASDDTSADLRDMRLDTAYVRRIAGRDVENCLPPGGPRRQTEPALPLTGDARSTRVATSSSAAIRWPRRVGDQPPAVRIGGKRSMLTSGGERRRGPKVSVASGSVKVRATRSVASPFRFPCSPRRTSWPRPEEQTSLSGMSCRLARGTRANSILFARS